MESSGPWLMEATKASSVCPLSVRPEASLSVALTITGMSSPRSAQRSMMAFIAHFALSVSKTVSMSSMSAPPSMRPRACS